MESRQQRICLFGGTFDPIHLGHSHIAETAIRELELDQLIFLPCKQSPHKLEQQPTSGEDRIKMCQLATRDMTTVSVDDFDLTAPEPSYSWRTAEHMQARYPNARLFWLMGTDQWEALPRWNRYKYLGELVEFIVFTRGNNPEPRKGFRMHCIQGNHPASATEIRKSIRSGDFSTAQSWLHENVLSHIHTQQLYKK